ncbi:MAG: DUF4198 domain-containing protein [Vibrio sp.]
MKYIPLLRMTFVAVLLSFSQWVSAHEFWIVAHDAETKTDQKVLFEVRTGSGWPGEQTARITNLIDTFKAWDQQGEYEVAGHDGTLVFGHINPRISGATIVSLRTNPAQLSLPADEFEQYLEEEGLTKIIQTRADNGESSLPDLEYFSRAAKSLIIVDGKSAGFDHKMGLPLELIPHTDPVTYHANQPFKLQLLSNGSPLADTQIKAQTKSHPDILLVARTDKDGNVEFQLPNSGDWVFSAVDMARADIPDVDWQSIWASLSLKISQK